MSVVRNLRVTMIAAAVLTLVGTMGSAFADNNQYTTGKGGRMGNMKGMMHKPMHHHHHYKHHMKKKMM